MTIWEIIIKNIATFKKNCKYSKTITDKLVSLIDSYDLLVIYQFLQYGLSVIDSIIDRIWQILLYLQFLKNVAVYLIILNLITNFATIHIIIVLSDHLFFGFYSIIIIQHKIISIHQYFLWIRSLQIIL